MTVVIMMLVDSMQSHTLVQSSWNTKEQLLGFMKGGHTTDTPQH